MPESLKVLGQLDMPAGAYTDIYTVPALTSAVVSTVYVCNTQGSVNYFTLLVSVAGASPTFNQFVYYNQAIPPYETFASTTGITLGETDVVRGYAANTGLTFSLFGAEKT